MANKVKFGLKSLYYAPITVGTGGTEVYGTPVAMPGAISMSLAKEGDSVELWADDTIYFSGSSGGGYSGTVELALVPESFKSDILGFEATTNGGLAENADASTTYFALLGEFGGDDEQQRFVFFKCTADRPDVAYATIENSRTPQTETLNIKAIPADISSKRLTVWRADSNDTAYTSWFTAVQTPEFTI